MLGILVQIVEYVDSNQPGWVRCFFKDAYGKEWTIIEKTPIVTDELLDEKSSYPMQGFVACEIMNVKIDYTGNEILTIDLDKPWCVSEINGRTVFDVFKNQIIYK